MNLKRRLPCRRKRVQHLSVVFPLWRLAKCFQSRRETARNGMRIRDIWGSLKLKATTKEPELAERERTRLPHTFGREAPRLLRFVLPWLANREIGLRFFFLLFFHGAAEFFTDAVFLEKKPSHIPTHLLVRSLSCNQPERRKFQTREDNGAVLQFCSIYARENLVVQTFASCFFDLPEFCYEKFASKINIWVGTVE